VIALVRVALVLAWVGCGVWSAGYYIGHALGRYRAVLTPELRREVIFLGLLSGVVCGPLDFLVNTLGGWNRHGWRLR